MSVFAVFWSAFSRIRNEYGEILRISPYLVQIWENANQKNPEYRHYSRTVYQKHGFTNQSWKLCNVNFSLETKHVKSCLQKTVSLKLFHNLFASFFFKQLRKAPELWKISKYWSLKETGMSHEQNVVFIDNPKQNILQKLKKSSKSRQDQNTLIFAW